MESINDRIDGPIVFFSGADDDVMDWNWVKHTFARLQGTNNVELWREDGVKHEDDGHFIAHFLSRLLPPPSVTEQLNAYEKRDIFT